MSLVEYKGQQLPDPGPGMHYVAAPDDPNANIHRAPIPVHDADARPVADGDVLIARPDLWPDVFTRVAAGDRIPLELVDNDRHPVVAVVGPNVEPKPSRRRSKA